MAQVGPLDVIKIRFQVQLEPIAELGAKHKAKFIPKYTSFRQALMTIFREEGIQVGRHSLPRHSGHACPLCRMVARSISCLQHAGGCATMPCWGREVLYQFEGPCASKLCVPGVVGYAYQHSRTRTHVPTRSKPQVCFAMHAPVAGAVARYRARLAAHSSIYVGTICCAPSGQAACGRLRSDRYGHRRGQGRLAADMWVSGRLVAGRVTGCRMHVSCVRKWHQLGLCAAPVASSP